MLIQRTAHALAKMLIANIINYAYYIVNLLFLFLVHAITSTQRNSTAFLLAAHNPQQDVLRLRL